MGVKENPSGGFVVEALKLMPLLLQSVQEQYEQLVCVDQYLSDTNHNHGNQPSN